MFKGWWFQRCLSFSPGNLRVILRVFGKALSKENGSDLGVGFTRKLGEIIQF